MEKLINLSRNVAKKRLAKPKEYEEQPAQLVADLLVDPTRPRTMKQMLPNPDPEKHIPIVQERLPTAVIDLQERNLREYREKKQKQWNFEQETEKDLMAKQKESLTNIMQQKDMQKHNDQLIKDSLNSQQEALQERLRQRRERSFNKSASKAGGSGVKPSSQVNKAAEESGPSPEKLLLSEADDGLTPEQVSNNILQLLDRYKAPDRRQPPQ